jgi:hypothetical protein
VVKATATIMATALADAPPCECDVLRVKTLGVFWFVSGRELARCGMLG